MYTATELSGEQCAAWFALQVKCRYEKAIATALRHKGFEEFLPVNRVTHKWCDRIKTIEVPLFPGYVFCQFGLHDRLRVAVTPGVISIVGAGRNPMPVNDAEIEALRKVVAAGVQALPHEFLPVGTKVGITAGPLQGLRGILSHINKRRTLVISVTILQRSVAVEVDPDVVVRVDKPLGTALAFSAP